MPEVTVIAGVLSGVLGLIAQIPYLISIFRGKTKPERASWVIWAIMEICVAATYAASGAGHSLFMPIGFALASSVTALLSIKYGVGGTSRLDLLCLVGAGFGIILWLLSGSAEIGLTIEMIVYGLGDIPTWRKMYREPETEDRTAWTIGFIAACLNAFAVEAWTYGTILYTAGLILGYSIFMALLYRPRKPTASAVRI